MWIFLSFPLTIESKISKQNKKQEDSKVNMPRNMENLKLRKNHVQIGGSGAIRGGGGGGGRGTQSHFAQNRR